MKGLQTLKNRWKAKTPIFFKRICGFCASITGMAVLIHGAFVGYGIDEPQWFQTILPHIVFTGTAVATVAKFAKDDIESDK